MSEPQYALRQNFLSVTRYTQGGVTASSMLILCLVLSQCYWTEWQPLAHFLVASAENVFTQGEYWRLVTTVFVHGDLGHLLSNSLMLALMGFFVYSHYGPSVFPLLGILMGGATNFFVLKTLGPEQKILGISGVVYFLWGYWLILYILIQRHIGLNRRIMKVMAVTLLILVPSSYKPDVSYLSHGLGILLGMGCGIFYYFVRRKFIRSFEVWEEVEEVDELALEDV